MLDEVRWQVAWWALVPLALGAMSQPCGHVLGHRKLNYRFYIRASPIICVVDMLHFLGHVVWGSRLKPTELVPSFKRQIQKRFSGDDGKYDLERAESSTLIRLALTIVGGIPCQTIKLVAMEGIPWTKAWALMFFVSIVLGEVLILAARRTTTVAARNMDEDESPAWAISIVPHRIVFIFPTTRLLVLFSCVIIFRWPVVGVLICFLFMSCSFCGFLFDAWFSWEVVVAAATYLGTILLLPGLHLSPAGWSIQSRHSFIGAMFTMLDAVPFSLDSAIKIFIAGANMGFILVAGILWPLSRTVSSILGRTKLKELLRVASPDERIAAGVCIETLTVSLLYYGFAYDSAGTVNPEWASVFG